MHRQDFLSFFTDFKERKMTSVWVGKKYMPDEIPPAFEPEYFGAKHITTPNIHPVPGRDSSPCVVVGNGAWHEKIYHFLPDRPPSSAGDEIQTEYFVRYEDFTKIMEELYKIRESFKHLIQCSEIRMCKGDSIPMSPAKGETDFIGIHFTWFRKQS
jgi:alditol oxidase